VTTPQSRQEALYEAIHDDYSRNLYDAPSTAYRDRFIHAPMFAGLDLNGAVMAEVMCGDGPATTYVKERFPAAACHGYDLSPAACAAYSARTGFTAVRHDIIGGALPPAAFDVVAVVGGLHHVVADLDAVVANIHGSLKPGGVFTMMEPNRDYVLEIVRRVWYRFDRYFDERSEAALSYPELSARFGALFEERAVTYGGGPAYFLVLMNMVFRIPQSWKRLYAPALMLAERAWRSVPVRQTQAFFVAQWVKPARPSKAPGR
jgi:SAM-dependent methyltransferase